MQEGIGLYSLEKQFAPHQEEGRRKEQVGKERGRGERRGRGRMGGSEGGEPRRAAEIKQPRLGRPAGGRGLGVALPRFPKWLEARESPGQTAGPLSPPGGPASV